MAVTLKFGVGVYVSPYLVENDSFQAFWMVRMLLLICQCLKVILHVIWANLFAEVLEMELDIWHLKKKSAH